MAKKKILRRSSKKSKTSPLQLVLVFTTLSVFLFTIYQSIIKFTPNLSCANSISCIKNISGIFEKGVKKGEFMGKKVDVSAALAEILPPKAVLGQTSEQKRIYIDLTSQKLFAKENDTTIFEFPVSTGKWYETPTGVFSIWIKLRYTRMTGGNRDWGTFYDLPNVPYTMFFYNSSHPRSQGFGIHGAYWHNNFGHPMSHGCVNMKTEDVARLFAWANPQSFGWASRATDDNPGTTVIIYGQTPKE